MTEDLLQVYDDEVRGSFAARLPEGWTAETDGPLVRCRTTPRGFAMLTGPVEPAALPELVSRTVDAYAAHGEAFEFKTFDHDPPELRPLLLAAGAEPEDHEALVMGEAARLAVPAELPAGVILREVHERADLDRVAAMESEVWGEDWSWLADDLAARLAGDEPIHVFVAEADDTVVSAAWLTPVPGTRVAGLWGGSTLAEWRGRGVYRALVAARAALAVELGHTVLQVDASDDSRPILERLGLQVVGGTQPFIVGG